MSLVAELSRQIAQLSQKIEIRVCDDCSHSEYTNQISKIIDIPYCRFEALKHNIGRTKIRNYLAQQVQGEYLLFIDGDSQIVNPNFIANYLNNLQDLVSGGTVYQERKPDAVYTLHWKQGRTREVYDLSTRSQNPYYYFKTNNFLIKRDIMLAHPFDERIVSYGYEDNVFAEVMKRNNIQITVIDNPVEHIGLETNITFLEKTQQGILNAIDIQKRNPNFSTRLLTSYDRIVKTPFGAIFLEILQLSVPVLKKQLLSKNPVLLCLDIYKLIFLHGSLKKIRNPNSAEA